ncbi:methylated-DNA--[protein]-cysteine S-methyltransferase [Taibaiella koreensis]|uniref:methylated-DNA--[protein]-cysteine S-methyltransferase n=1 Tax=Taibaiella koreensis TaxID=1268548 RepID=UPI000E59F6C5|nr:methylated-DNA--[protein]-cysteine S-methyltransferase [Taibaiella koreensis]
MYTSFYQSPLGPVRISASEQGLLSVSFIEEAQGQYLTEPVLANTLSRLAAQQLDEYFNGKRRAFDLPLLPTGTAFQEAVWRELVKVPFGKTESYGYIAHQLNNPLSIRAVGSANNRNPIAVFIPCHRIIGADGSLTGYAGGLWRKEYLLKLERAGQPVQTSLW